MKYKIWIQAARPKTLIASLSPVLIGTVVASRSAFHPLTFIFTLLTALCIQISTNFVNDYCDFLKGADTIERKGPVRVVQAGLISVDAMKKATLLMFAFGILCGLYLIWQGGVIIACLLGMSLLLGFAYTAGPFPLAYLGLGELFVFTFFGFIATGGTYFLQTGTLSSSALLAGIAPGALSSAILAMNNVRDIQEDKAANKKTLAVRFGKTFGKVEYALLLSAALLTPFLFIQDHPFLLLLLTLFFPAIKLTAALFKNSSPYLLNPLFQQTAQLLTLYTLLFCVIWCI